MNWSNALTVTNGLSAIAVGMFAWLQWSLMKRNEQQRRDEREQDQLQRHDTASATIHAEWFRMWTVAINWNEADLIQQIEAGQFDPGDILPRDWAGATSQLGLLGVATSKIGSFGFAIAHDAHRAAQSLAADYDALVHAWTTAEGQQAFRDQHMPSIRERERMVKELALEAANIIQDALDHAPDAKLPRRIDFNDAPHSKHVKRLAAAAAEKYPSAPLAESTQTWKFLLKEE